MFSAKTIGVALLAPVLAALAACGARQPPLEFSPLAQELVYSTLAFSPVAATARGYHQHEGRRLDEMLDDFSPEALNARRLFYRDFRERLARVNQDSLRPADRADFRIITDQIALALLELDTLQSWRRNPNVYVELVGNAVFAPHVLEYAPREERVRHIVARLRKVPTLLEQAKANLADSPRIWTTAALEGNQGNVALIDGTIRANVPEPLRAGYDEAASAALTALRDFSSHLRVHLARHDSEWRLGEENYRLKFRHSLQTDLAPGQVLAAAESELEAVRTRILELARPLYSEWFPRRREHPDANTLVSAVLDGIAHRHPTPDNYLSDARRVVEEARAFVRASELLPLPVRDNLSVIEIPEFMRGSYAGGGCMPAPALEPKLGAFYWLTPILKEGPRERVRSKLREYNFYRLNLLTMQETMPGRYVQFEYANNVQPRPRRLLRSVFGNGPYIEGWAHYITEAMLEAGYLDNSPELRLAFEKERLRVLTDAIIDIRLHSMRMTDRQAVDFMMRETFQEREEAVATLRRAMLSSCHLPASYVGWRDWVRARDHVRAVDGRDFRTSVFHARALKQGAVPLPLLGSLLTENRPGGASKL